MIKSAFLFCCVAVFLSSIEAFSKKDIQTSLGNFAKLDSDGDGIITYKEFVSNGPKVYTERAPSSNVEWTVLFDIIDISDNLQVDVREFVISDTIHTEFCKYDDDNNGVLSKVELMNSIDIGDDKLAGNKATFLEYFTLIITDEKLVGNWRENVGKISN